MKNLWFAMFGRLKSVYNIQNVKPKEQSCTAAGYLNGTYKGTVVGCLNHLTTASISSVYIPIIDPSAIEKIQNMYGK